MPLARHDEHLRERHRQERMFLLTCLLRGMTQVTAEKGCNSKFLLTCLLRGMTRRTQTLAHIRNVSTHMPLARHDLEAMLEDCKRRVSTHMPLARHDFSSYILRLLFEFLLTCLLRGMTRLSGRLPSRTEFLLTCLLRGMTQYVMGK